MLVYSRRRSMREQEELVALVAVATGGRRDRLLDLLYEAQLLLPGLARLLRDKGAEAEENRAQERAMLSALLAHGGQSGRVHVSPQALACSSRGPPRLQAPRCLSAFVWLDALCLPCLMTCGCSRFELVQRTRIDAPPTDKQAHASQRKSTGPGRAARSCF